MINTTTVDVTTLNNLRGKYIKQVLQRLEESKLDNKLARKIVLDGINDLMREILKELGHIEE